MDCSTAESMVNRYIDHQLDENGKDQILDFRELLEEDIRKSRRYILKKKFFRTVFGVGICILAAGLAGFLFYAVTQLL